MAALAAGKHVYTEKPLATRRADGAATLALAREKGLRVGSAPDTFLGGGLQTCRKLIDDGAIGEPVAAVAFMTGHGPEGWHPDPEFFYKPGAGPMFDMGPYYLTALVSLLGPIARVTGSARISFPERTIGSGPKQGQQIVVETPTHVAGVLDFAGGAVATIITSFDVWAANLPRIEDLRVGGLAQRARSEHLRRAGADPAGEGQGVARRAADPRLHREQPRPGRGRHGERDPRRPPASGQRRAGVSRAGRDGRVRGGLDRGPPHGDHQRPAAGRGAARGLIRGRRSIVRPRTYPKENLALPFASCLTAQSL